MLTHFLNAFKALSVSDKILLAVAIVILVNPTIAFIAAILIVAYFIWLIVKEIRKAEEANA